MKVDTITLLPRGAGVRENRVTSFPCTGCGSVAEVLMTNWQLHTMWRGDLVQDVLPNETPAVRERFITDTCTSCLLGPLA